MKRILIIGIYFVAFIFQAYGQKLNTIWDIRIASTDGKIEITYDLKSKHQVNNIDLKIKTSSGVIIQPIQVTGDIGKGISVGENKKIIWDLEKENRVLDEKIDVILGLNHFNGINVSKHFWSSVFYPGAGDYRLANKSHYFLYGMLGYGSIGASIYFNFSAANNYNRYLNSYNHVESEKLFQQAKVEQAISWALVGTAAAIWVADLTSVLIKSSKLKKAYQQNSLTQQQSKFYNNKMNDFTEHLASEYVNTKSQHDILVEAGIDAYNQKDYEKAKEKLSAAVKLKSSEKANYWLLETNKKIEFIALMEKKYNQFVASGDSIYDDTKQASLLKKYDYKMLINKYKFAIQKYEEARSLGTNNFIHTSKIYRCEDEIEILNEEIGKANLLFSADSLNALGLAVNNIEKKIDFFNRSILKYKELKKIDPSNATANKQISILSDLIYDIQVKRIVNFIKNNQLDDAETLLEELVKIEINDLRKPDRKLFYDEKYEEIKVKRDLLEYNDKIAKADAAFKTKDYDKAKKYYQEAKIYKPNETYPSDQITIIDKLTTPITLFPTSSWTSFPLLNNNFIELTFEGRKGVSCNSKTFKYQFRCNLKTSKDIAIINSKKFLKFKVDYIDCANNLKYCETVCIDLHKIINEGSDVYVESIFKITTFEILTKPYSIIQSNDDIIDKPKLVK
jgi:hypothetical protein